MRTITLALVAACLFAAAARAQTYDVYKYSRTETLAGTSAVFTVALPANGLNNQTEILDFTIQCAVDCVVSTEQNGSAPAGTVGAWRPENPTTAPKLGDGSAKQPAVSIYRGSNSTGGIAGDEPFTFPAGAIVPWDAGGVVLTGAGPTINYTIRIGPITGQYRFQLRVRSRR